MKDSTIKRIHDFTEERNWDQFHSPENLAKSIVIEAAELLENFQWNGSLNPNHNVAEELADVLVYCVQLSEKLGYDIDEIINQKMDKNELKYPVELAKGSDKKYTEFFK